MIDLYFGAGIFPIHSCIGSVYLPVYVMAGMCPEEDSLPNGMVEAVGDQS